MPTYYSFELNCILILETYGAGYIVLSHFTVHSNDKRGIARKVMTTNAFWVLFFLTLMLSLNTNKTLKWLNHMKRYCDCTLHWKKFLNCLLYCTHFWCNWISLHFVHTLCLGRGSAQNSTRTMALVPLITKSLVVLPLILGGPVMFRTICCWYAVDDVLLPRIVLEARHFYLPWSLHCRLVRTRTLPSPLLTAPSSVCWSQA